MTRRYDTSLINIHKKYILELNNAAKIGNSYIRQILGDEKKHIRKEVYNPDGSIKIVYENERDKFKLYHKEMRFAPRSVLRMAILLPMFEIKLEEGTNNGYIPQVNFWELSQILKCTRPQVKFALNYLQDMGMIKLKHEFNCGNLRVYRITIVDYQKFFLPAKKGGAGYFELTKEKFYELISIQDVNELRIELAHLIMNGLQDGNDHFIDFDDISFCLPPYARRRKVYLKKSKKSTLFSVHANKYRQMVIKSTYNMKERIKELVQKARPCIDDALFYYFGNNVKNKYLDEIAQMAVHFQTEHLVRSIEYAAKYHFNYLLQSKNSEDKKFKNFSAVIYSICRDRFYCMDYSKNSWKHF